MGRKSRTAVLKRQREVRKAEKAAMKREKRAQRDAADSSGEVVATPEDLEGYGFGSDEAEAEDAESEAPPAPGSGTGPEWILVAALARRSARRPVCRDHVTQDLEGDQRGR